MGVNALKWIFFHVFLFSVEAELYKVSRKGRNGSNDDPDENNLNKIMITISDFFMKSVEN